MLTWREIKDALNELSEEQLQMSAVILDADRMETMPITNSFLLSELPSRFQEEFEDVYDDDVPLLVIGNIEPEDDDDDFDE